MMSFSYEIDEVIEEMKVYVVMKWDDDCRKDVIDGVFTTEKSAKKYVAQSNLYSRRGDEYWYVEVNQYKYGTLMGPIHGI